MQIDPTLEKLIQYSVTNNASDLHLSSNSRPIVRIDGELAKIPDTTSIGSAELMKMLGSVMSDTQKTVYQEKLELDFAIANSSGIRFRVNSFHSINGPAAVLRAIPSENVSLLEISAPAIFSDLCKLEQGLILVVGPTGSGKSTT